MRTDAALVVMAKAPLPGEVKTRLGGSMTPEKLAELSRCFFLDAMDLAMETQGCEVILCYAPDDELEAFPLSGLPDVECIPQGEGDLGLRMRHTVDVLLERGYLKVVLIGTDLPTLPGSHLEAAFSILDPSPVVLGPALDGGYYLLGMRVMIPEIFEGIDWGTDQVLRQTRERLEQAGMQPGSVSPWYDVDRRGELDFLLAHLDLLRRGEGGRLPVHTLAFFEVEGLLAGRRDESRHRYERRAR